MTLPTITTREEWRAARKDLLAREKALTRARDALNTERRNLPMVEITEDYRFEGPDGDCLLYTSPSPRDGLLSRMPSSA